MHDKPCDLGKPSVTAEVHLDWTATEDESAELFGLLRAHAAESPYVQQLIADGALGGQA
jgi:hypothetical protein